MIQETKAHVQTHTHTNKINCNTIFFPIHLKLKYVINKLIFKLKYLTNTMQCYYVMTWYVYLLCND